MGLKGISASLPVACLEFPGVSRKESLRGLGFLSASTCRAPGPAALFLLVPTRCPAALFIPRRAPSPRGDPRLAIAPGTPADIFAATPGTASRAGRGPEDSPPLPGCGDRRTDRWMDRRTPTVGHAPDRAPGRAPAGWDRGALKGATPRPPTPPQDGAAAPLPIGWPRPAGLSDWAALPRPRLSLGSDWLFAISRGPRPFSRLRLARARAPAAL